MENPLKTLAEAKILEFDPAVLEPFLSGLRDRVRDRALAIVAYGSCLSDVTRSATSTPDFYVIVPSYRGFHAMRMHAILNWFLPPNIYNLEMDGRVSKYNVISLQDLERETRGRAPDCYNVGRMSKRIALAWSRTPEFVSTMGEIHAASMRSIARWTFFLMPERFTLEEFVREALRITYRADVRVEAGDKTEKLFQAEKDFYTEAYALCLADLVSDGWLAATEGGGFYEKHSRPVRNGIGALRLRVFLARSRLRAQARWPKGIFTVEHWIDYLLAKIERTQGIRIVLTGRERKYWYVFAWKHFFRLRRKNLIK